MRAWVGIIGGGAVAYAMARHRDRTLRELRTPTLASPLPGRWVWPVARWRGRAPVISNPFGTVYRDGTRHKGVDVMFRRLPSDAFAAGSPNGSKGYVMPDGRLALAASAGVVWSAMKTPRGYAVVIDHGETAKVATFYTHLERLLVTPTANGKAGQRVHAGQPIGIIGADPLDPAHLEHLHFELWLGGPSDAVDPAGVMRGWGAIDDIEAEPGALVARNAGFRYRPVGASGEPYPEWVRALKGKAGVYVIRDADTHEVQYVGSSAGKLYATLTRHFQTWRRFKGFWRDQYGEGHDPGLTYPRDSVEVAVRLTSPSASLDEEMRLIARLRPRDNLIGQPALADAEAAPF